jgi:hypothetical protein
MGVVILKVFNKEVRDEGVVSKFGTEALTRLKVSSKKNAGSGDDIKARLPGVEGVNAEEH